MSHAKQVMRSGVKVFSSQILINLFSIGFIIFLSRTLDKTDFATFAVFAILGGLIKLTVNLGLETSCIQRVPELIAKGENDKASAMLKTTFLSRTLLSIFFALLIFSLSSTVSKIFLKTDEYNHIIQIMSLGILFSSLVDSLGLLTQITQQFGKISIINVIVNVSSRVSSIVLYFIFGLKGYIIGFAWTPVIGIILFLWLLRKWLFVKSSYYSWLKLVKYSLPFYAKGYMRFCLMQFDMLVIGIFLEPATLATYFIARKFSEYIFMISNSFGNPVLIKIAELKNNGLDYVAKIFGRVSRYFSFLFVPLCIGTASTSYFLLNLYGGHKYTDGTFILILLSLGMLMYCLSGPYVMNVYLLGKPKEALKVAAAGGVVNIVFTIGTIFFFGIAGVAFARLMGYITSFFYGRQLLKKLITAEFDMEALKNSLIASLGMAAVIVILQLIYYNLVIIPLYILAGFITFMLILCRRLDIKDIKLLEDFLPIRFKRLVKVFYWFGSPKLELV